MPVLRAKIDGVWQDVAGMSTGNNADTLDGQHADEFASASDVDALQELVGDTSVVDRIQTHNTDAEAHADIRETISNLPITIDENGYTDISGLRQIITMDVTKSSNVITMAYELQGDQSYVDTITLDDNGYPTFISSNGIDCVISWEGF